MDSLETHTHSLSLLLSLSLSYSLSPALSLSLLLSLSCSLSLSPALSLLLSLTLSFSLSVSLSDGSYGEHGREIFDEEVTLPVVTEKEKVAKRKVARPAASNIKTMLMGRGEGGQGQRRKKRKEVCHSNVSPSPP